MINFKTNKGSFTIELNKDEAPISSENFLNYVNKGFYKGTIFHRVIDGFMIQGGGFDENMNQKETDAPIKNEASNGLKNEAMFNQKLKFELHVVKLDCCDDWVEDEILRAKMTLEEDDLPQGSKFCDTCQYLKKRWHVSQNLNIG